VRWARLSERAHLSAAGPSIETRALLVTGRRDQAVGSSASLADLSPSSSSMSATLEGDLEGVPGVVGAPRRGPVFSACHKPAISTVQTEKHRTSPRNVDHAEKTSAGAYLATCEGGPAP
jgi:hypothetical protein